MQNVTVIRIVPIGGGIRSGKLTIKYGPRESRGTDRMSMVSRVKDPAMLQHGIVRRQA